MNAILTVEKDNLRAFLRDSLGVDTQYLDDSEPLFSSGILDSFSMVELLIFIEKSINKKLNPADISLENFDSVEKILHFAALAADV